MTLPPQDPQGFAGTPALWLICPACRWIYADTLAGQLVMALCPRCLRGLLRVAWALGDEIARFHYRHYHVVWSDQWMREPGR